MSAWTQVYDPLGSPFFSTLLAAMPIVLLLGLLATGRVSAVKAAAVGLAAALLIAVFCYVPSDVGAADAGADVAPGYFSRLAGWAPTMLAAAVNGAAFGLFPIGWIVLMAIFLYTLTVETGQFEIVKHSIVSLSDDRRIQALLIAFAFGAFVEGAAGFGTPVAISAALLVGAGFRPLYAAGLALIANTSPVAFGALGTPTLTLANVTGLDLMDLSAMAGRQLPLFSLIVPVWLVVTMAGWRGALAVWPALAVCGVSFAAVQFTVANFVGPELVDIAGGLAVILCLTLFLRFWQPRENWHFPDEKEHQSDSRPNDSSAAAEPGCSTATEAAGSVAAGSDAASYTRRQIAAAWVPWLLLTVLVFLWGLPQVKNILGNPAKYRANFNASEEGAWLAPTSLSLKMPGLHRQIARDEPVVQKREKETAIFDFNWLSATGTGILIAAILSAAWLRVGPRRFFSILALTCRRMLWPLVTIACMLAIAFTTRYSGMDATLGLAFTKTGAIYPIFAALLGWLGVALTGSDTSSNALFGSLQKITAEGLVRDRVLPLTADQASVLLCTANSTGGVMGKMIDAQSIVVSAAATGQHGQEGPILRFVFWHSLALALLMGLLVLIQAYWLTWMIPG
jgi:lactate permease